MVEGIQMPSIEAPKKDSWMGKFIVVSSLLQIVLLAVIAFQLSGFEGGSENALQGAAVAGAQPQAAPSAPSVDMKALLDDDAVKGDPKAPVTIVEFSDYECPFCSRFYTDTFILLNERYIKTGKVKFVYRDFPLSFHPSSQKAAEAAECSGEQNKYYEMHDKLFENQGSWASQGPSVSVPLFKQYAQQIGLNTAQFNTCLDSGKMTGEVRKDLADGSAAGVQGTPAFYVNGQEISGAQPFQVFQQIIDAELAG